MATSRDPVVPPRVFTPLAGFLSFLVPGLGQISQGRVAKGLLFLFCLYGMFFFGMYLGDWKNVYLPDTAKNNNPWKLKPPVLANVWNRLHFAGQVWIGVAAWPAISQYVSYDDNKNTGPIFGTFQRTPREEELNQLQRDGNKAWDLGWVYTVVAGVLNILVIYDAFAGPAFAEGELMMQSSRTEAAA
jgi:hypothetical protein